MNFVIRHPPGYPQDMTRPQIKDRLAPYGMLAAGVIIILARPLIQSGPLDAVATFGWLAITMIVGVGLMALGCWITAKLLGTVFGDERVAFVKLAAIFLFPTAIGSLLPPWWSSLVATALYFGLLLWLFDLDVYEAAVFALVMILIRGGIFAVLQHAPNISRIM